MRSQHACASIGTLLLGAVLVTPLPALAGDDCAHTHRVACIPSMLFRSDPSPTAEKPVQKSPESHVLLSLDRVPPAPPRVRSELIFSVKRGVEYRSHFAVGAHRLSLSLWGPVVQKKPGVGVELKGLAVGSHDVRVEAYGNTGQGRIRVKLAF
jgi:hypothetical protein